MIYFCLVQSVSTQMESTLLLKMLIRRQGLQQDTGALCLKPAFNLCCFTISVVFKKPFCLSQIYLFLMSQLLLTVINVVFILMYPQDGP